MTQSDTATTETAILLQPETQDGGAETPNPPGEAAADTAPARPARPKLFARMREALMRRGKSTIRAELTEALEEIGTALPGSFSAGERALLQNVLQLRELRVDDVMVPRADIDAVDADATLADLILSFRNAGHSRLPVYEDTLDNIVGFVHIKDAVQHLTEETKPDGAAARSRVPVKMLHAHLRHRIGAERMVRTVLFVPPSMPVEDLLQQMRARRLHMAIVVDEYGGTDGLVTIEDLLESVVGDIEDEHDEEGGPLVKKTGEGTFIADARVELVELRAELGPDFDPGERMEEVDTLGGLLFDLEGRVPVRGEVITRFKGFEFEILEADARRIKRVRIVVRKRASRARPATRPSDPEPEKS